MNAILGAWASNTALPLGGGTALPLGDAGSAGLRCWTLLGEEGAAARAPGVSDMLPMFAVVFALFYFMVLRPQRSKEQQFRSLIENLKEKDRVVTIGGIHAVVTNIQRDAEIVTLRIDESTGTKIRVGVSAIARVLVDEEKGAAKA
jgi:preprotein translocase subunit YajC